MTVFDANERSQRATLAMEAQVIIEEGRMFPRAFSETTMPIRAIFNPRGKRALVALTGSDVVAVIDTAKWEVGDTFATDKEPDGLGWSTLVIKSDAE